MSAKDEGLIGLVEVPRNQAQLLLESGYFYMEKGQFQEAQKVFEGCVSLLPRSEVPHLGLGHLFQSQGRKAEAVASFQEAIKMRPDSAEAHAFLGEAYLLQGKPAQALPMLDKAEELDKANPPAAAELARSLRQAHKEGAFDQ